MSNVRTQTLWPGVSAALSALLRLVRAVAGLALLIGLTLFALAVAAVFVLRAALAGRRFAAAPAGGPDPMRRASASRSRGTPGDVVDVETRVIPSPPAHHD